jgi:hypothetical protein
VRNGVAPSHCRIKQLRCDSISVSLVTHIARVEEVGRHLVPGARHLTVLRSDEYKIGQDLYDENHGSFGRAVGIQLVEAGDAAGCMFNPSMAAMLANYWC